MLVAVKTAGINPGETVIRRGAMPGPLPTGQGADLAGLIAEVGSGVDAFKVGDEVLGFCPNSSRASQAEFAVVPAKNLTRKPPEVSWEVAGALFAAGTTAYSGVRAVAVAAGDTVVVSAASGGVGTIAVQLAKHAGATVIGIASPSSDDWLFAHGVIPVNHGDNLADRLKAAAPQGRIDAFLDFFGGGYVKLAVEELGVPPRRVNTSIDFPALVTYPIQAAGSAHAANADVLADWQSFSPTATLRFLSPAYTRSTMFGRHIVSSNNGIRWAKSYFTYRGGETSRNNGEQAMQFGRRPCWREATSQGHDGLNRFRDG